ncbi:type II toxin-antitoxin system RelE/ParE family toxin [Rhodopila sp.]|uniref:type II toxin-antitoxin system RelE/ParE family toxin n=1 Tax=Rhodopila sp. TaxID=2480087 RepID=UPI003D11A9EE
MAYRVDLTERAARNLRRIYLTISADDSAQARAWFNEQAVLSLDEHSARGTPIPKNADLRHLLYGRKRHRYRIIHAVDERNSIVTVLHIRHGARDAFQKDETDNDAVP